MRKSPDPFYEIWNRLKTEPVQPFGRRPQLAKRYLKKVQGRNINLLLIGWICERGSPFAYLYKRMKKEAKDEKTTRLAADIARAGFPAIMPDVHQWVLESELPVLIVPVPSRHGVSERFAAELYQMLDERAKKASEVKELLVRSDKTTQIKVINGWSKRSRAAESLFSVDPKQKLDQYAVMLVDDIVTSGSSLRKSASLLKSNGVKDIIGVSLATNLFDSI